MNPRILIVLALLLGGAGFFALRSGPSDAATDTLNPSAPAQDADVADGDSADLRADDVARNGEGEARSAAPLNEKGANAAPDAETSYRTWQGRVLDPLGNGVSGARVELIGEGAPGILNLNVFGSKDEVTTGETDAVGRFSIRAALTEASPQLRVLAHGFRILETQAETTELGNLALERGAVVTGVVLTADNHPVAGARVTRSAAHDAPGTFSVTIDAPYDGPSSAGSGRAREGSTRTADDGTFELPHEPPGAYRLAAQHDEFPKAIVHGEVAIGGTSEERVQFERAGILEGVLLGFAPGDRSKLRVRCRRVDGSNAESTGGIRIPGMTNSDQNTTLGDDGTFTLEGLVVGASYEVWATEEMGGFWESDTCSEVLTAMVPSTGLVLHFIVGGRLQFQVADAKTLEPVTPRRWSP